MIPKKEGTVIIQSEGKEYSGRYHFDKDILTVSYKYWTEKGSLTPGSDPELLAKIILTNIIKKELKK